MSSSAMDTPNSVFDIIETSLKVVAATATQFYRFIQIMRFFAAPPVIHSKRDRCHQQDSPG